MTTRLDSRQSRQRALLDQLSNNTDVKLDTLLNLTNDELTQPLRLRQSNPTNLRLNIDSITVKTEDGAEGHGRTRTIQPISGVLPSFTPGYVEFPSASGGSITASGLTLATSYTLTVSSGNWIKVGVSINTSGQIVLNFGTQGASESAAGAPARTAGTRAIGYVSLQNSGGTIQNVTGARIYQYSDSSGLDSVSLTTDVTGILPIANGGTNLSALGSALQVLRVNAGGTALEYAAAGGDVSGPASATDNALARFDGTTGKLLQNSSVVVDDLGVVTMTLPTSGASTLNAHSGILFGNVSVGNQGPAIFGRQTNGTVNQPALILAAQTQVDSSAGDAAMAFVVANQNYTGALVNRTLFRWSNFATDIGSVSNTGAWTLGTSAASITHNIYGKASTTNTGVDRVNNSMVYFLSNSSQGGALALGYSQNSNRLYLTAFGNGVGVNDGFEFWTEPSAGTYINTVSFTGTGSTSFGHSGFAATHDFTSGGNTKLRVISTGSTGEFEMIRTGTSIGAVALSVSGNGSTGSLTFYTGTTGTPATTNVGGYDTSGSWTFGTTSTSGGRGSHSFRIPGSLGTGWVSIEAQNDVSFTDEIIGVRVRGNGDSAALMSWYKATGTFPYGVIYLNRGNNNYSYLWGESDGVIYTNSGFTPTTGVAVGTQTSDIRLKTNVIDIPYGLNEVLQLRPIHYTLSNKVRIGLSAQDVEQIIPEIVYDTTMELEGVQNIKHMYLADMNAVLIKAIQELHTMIAQLQTENASQSARLVALEEA